MNNANSPIIIFLGVVFVVSEFIQMASWLWVVLPAPFWVPVFLIPLVLVCYWVVVYFINQGDKNNNDR